MTQAPAHPKPDLALSNASDAHDPVEEFLKRRKKVTINDVASLAKVSKKTVSRIINNAPNVREETRQQVKDIIKRTGFKPDPQARGLAFRRAFLLGLIYDNPNAQYVVNMQTGALDALRGTGTELVVHPCDSKSEGFLDDIREFIELQRLSGVIILPPIAENRDLLSLLEELDVPYIRVTARSGDRNDPPIVSAQIVSKDYDGCYEAGIYLAELGHRDIGFIAGNIRYPSAHERRSGFEAGLGKKGLGIKPQFDEQGDYSFDSGYEAALKLLKGAQRPTAIFASNDEMAAGTYRAAYELGIRIPDDLSVMSFDDSPLATRLFPPLTSVRLPIRDMGCAAANALMTPDDQERPMAIFDAVLIKRGSTKAL